VSSISEVIYGEGIAMNNKLVDAILSYGERYRYEILLENGREKVPYTPAQLLDDWRKALRFFFERVFYQGRRDDISTKVLYAAYDVMDDRLFKLADLTGMDEEYLSALQAALGTRIGAGKIGKGGDIRMVISTLRYIHRLPRHNIVAYSADSIRAGRLREHYVDLQDSIYQVGPKVASLYLRDTVAALTLDKFITTDSWIWLQPVDVWVRKVARKTGIVTDGASDIEIQQAIVRLCTERSISPILFNQGVWYLGYNSFDLLLETLAQ
jgi:hypothetical protein